MNQFTKLPHLTAMFAVLALVTPALVGFELYATYVENRSIRGLSALMFTQKGQGSALQKAGFHQRDLLPVYGSSELLSQTAYQRPYHASAIFKDFPTGFTIFPIGKADTSDLIFLQKLAAVGESARGRKVVISLTPVWFFNRGEMIDADSYAGNFSRLHAYELAFSSELSLEVKRGAARRMLDYPNTLANDPLLRFALGSVADSSLAARYCYALAFPLGKIQTIVLRLQDHWEVLDYIRNRRGLNSSVARRIGDPEWSKLKARAAQECREHADNNPYGFDNDRWLHGYRQMVATQRAARTDANFLTDLEAAKEWTDLTLLLKGLSDLGAKPLILSAPIHGLFFDACGISPRSRQVYYDRLRALAREYNAGLMDFADHESDRDFQIDFGGHLSPKGWVYYAEAMNNFFHSSDEQPRFTDAAPAGSDADIRPERRPQAGESSPSAVHRVADYRGSLDRADLRQVAGWAWDQRQPDVPINVDIYDNDTLLATVTADRIRRDIVEQTRDSGKHGFVFPIPPSLKDGRPHSIRAVVSGSKFELAKSPRVIQAP